MKMMQTLQTWLLITVMALSANGAVNAKVASGGINLGSEVHWGLDDSKSLNALGISNVSTIDASGSSLAPNAGANPGTRAGATDAEAGGFSQYDQYRKADGSWDWPENLGFKGNPNESVLPAGSRIDRYGNEKGSFLSPEGIPYEQRALAPGSRAEPYNVYEVKKDLPVLEGEIAPAFGQPGGGKQILPNLPERRNVKQLLEEGYIERVEP